MSGVTAGLVQREYCAGPDGPRVIEWGTWQDPPRWCHTDGYPCPDSALKPSPAGAPAVQGVLL